MEKSTLHETATLVRFTTKFWSGIKSDKDLRSQLADDVSAQSDLLNVQKYLVGKEHSKYFRRIINKVRNEFYYPQTLPWNDNSSDDEGMVVSGWRLCPNSNLDNLIAQMSQSKRDFEKEVDEFLEFYPARIKQAKVLLGDAFDPLDYPDSDYIREKFRFEFETNMIPNYSSDIRLKVSASARAKIESDVTNRIQSNALSASKAIIDSLVEQVSHIADKVGQYDPKDKQGGFFKDSSFEKLRQAISVLPNFNKDILGDIPSVKDAHQNLVSIMAKIDSVDSLRQDSDESASKREEVSTDLKSAIDPLKGDFLAKLGGLKND